MREDWVECTLNELFPTIESGKRPKGGVQNIKDGIPSIGGEHLNNNGGFKFNSIKYVPNEFADGMDKGVINENDIIIVKDGATTGKTSLVTKDFPFQKAVINEHVLIIRLSSNICNKYIFYKLYSNDGKNDILKDFRGAAQGGISKSFDKFVKVPLPPLPEQRAIVKKIEALFSSLDAGISDLKKAQEQLKIYRQAVLKKAFEGEYKEVTLKDIILNISQGWSPKCLNTSRSNSDEWAVIKTTAIQHGAFKESENKILPTNLEPRIKHEIREGDVLITRAGPRVRVGVCCVVRKTTPRLINCDKVYKLELNQNILNSFFFEKLLNSSEYIKKIDFIKTGGSDSGVNLTQDRFLSLTIPLPSLEEQTQIVKEIEARLSVCDAVEKQIQDSLDQAEALRQSILKKAFEGRLLNEEELNLCKQAPDYEPASVLLAKIKAEKEANKAAKKKTTKKK